MTIAGRVLNALAPRPAPLPPRRHPTPERWASSLGFSITVPPEMTGDLMAPIAAVPRVSRDLAIQVPAVKKVRDLICGTGGTLELCQVTYPGFREVPAPLLEQPEEDRARSVTMTDLFEDMLFEKTAWWRIVSFGADGFPDRVIRLEPTSVTVQKTGRVWTNDSTLQAQGLSIGYQPDELLIRFDSPNDALLVAGARAIRTALLLGERADKSAKDPQPIGIITPEADVELDPDFDIDEAMDDFEDSRSRGQWAYMSGALKAQLLSWNPEQLQLMSMRDYAVLEIARIGGVDPEELGVSTTSRTYANSEQRRLDLIDFTIAAYVTAIQERLSMPDVTQPGRRVYFNYDAFLRSDTPSRMDVYAKGRAVGAYDDERIARAERIPVQRVRAAREAAQPAPAAPAPAGPPQREDTMQGAQRHLAAVGFTADPEPFQVDFVLSDEQRAEFAVDSPKRTITGMVMPWDVIGRSKGFKWAFAPGSLHYSDARRVKLDSNHIDGTEFGRAHDGGLVDTPAGLVGSFLVGTGRAGDEALALAAEGIKDGLSAMVHMGGEGDGWTPHPDDHTVRYVHSATLFKVAHTATPAFDDARVVSVAATRGGTPVTAPPAAPPAPVEPPETTPAPAPVPQAFDVAAFTAGMTESLKGMVADLMASLPQQRQVVPAGRLQSVREPMVYSLNGHGPSFVRDAWRSRTMGDEEARARLVKFEAQTIALMNESQVDPSFAINTGNASAVIPPGYRPDLYVTQLLRKRPMVDAISRGTIDNATPFTVPRFVSSATATADHVEGVNPSEGSLVLEPVTVQPGGISGRFRITREMADSANPAIDAIATQAMNESYSQQTEVKVYTELNGTNGVGGTITSGFVPSGAQATTTAGQGDELGFGIRAALAVYNYRRFADPDFGFLSQEATTQIAAAVGSDGRPMFPFYGPMNPLGQMSGLRGYEIDGQMFQKAWAMTGNAAGDADVIGGAKQDVWCWESPTLMFRFEEVAGPANIDLALFGYFAVRVLRPIGLFGIRHTAS